jgi:hypothetical protein
MRAISIFGCFLLSMFATAIGLFGIAGSPLPLNFCRRICGVHDVFIVLLGVEMASRVLGAIWIGLAVLPARVLYVLIRNSHPQKADENKQRGEGDCPPDTPKDKCD